MGGKTRGYIYGHGALLIICNSWCACVLLCDTALVSHRTVHLLGMETMSAPEAWELYNSNCDERKSQTDGKVAKCPGVWRTHLVLRGS